MSMSGERSSPKGSEEHGGGLFGVLIMNLRPVSGITVK